MSPEERTLRIVDGPDLHAIIASFSSWNRRASELVELSFAVIDERFHRISLVARKIANTGLYEVGLEGFLPSRRNILTTTLDIEVEHYDVRSRSGSLIFPNNRENFNLMLAETKRNRFGLH